MLHDFKTQKTTIPNTCPATAPTQKEVEATESTGYTWIMQKEERGCYKTLLEEIITTDLPGYRNFIRMEQHFLQPSQNDQEEQAQDENVSNPLREAKHQRDLLKDYFNNLGALAGQEDII